MNDTLFVKSEVFYFDRIPNSKTSQELKDEVSDKDTFVVVHLDLRPLVSSNVDKG